MLNQQTLDKLHTLKLTGMAEAFTDQINQPDLERLSFAERFGLIVDRQWTWKENNRMERYLKNARTYEGCHGQTVACAGITAPHFSSENAPSTC